MGDSPCSPRSHRFRYPTKRVARRDPPGCEGVARGSRSQPPQGVARVVRGCGCGLRGLRGRGGCERGREAPPRSRGVASLPRNPSQPRLLATLQGWWASVDGRGHHARLSVSRRPRPWGPHGALVPTPSVPPMWASSHYRLRCCRSASGGDLPARDNHHSCSTRFAARGVGP